MKLLLISFLLLLPVFGFTQDIYEITSVDSIKGRTYFFTCIRSLGEVEYEIKAARMTFRGMGKVEDLVGKEVMYFPNGYGRRKVRFIIVKYKKP